MKERVICARLPNALELLEKRRLLSADLAFADFKLSGGDLFHPGGTTIVTTRIVDLNGVGVPAGFSVGFRYVDVGFRQDDENVSYDDPAKKDLTSFTTSTAIPASAVGASFRFALTFPANLPQGRYELLGKVDDGNSVAESSESNNTRAFGAGRALPSDGNLLVSGSNGADHISITAYSKGGEQRYNVNVNGDVESFSAARITAFTVQCKGGDDSAVIIGAVSKVFCDGGDGNDKLVGGDGDDTLTGGAGKDTLLGGNGNDRLNGNAGNDRLFGEAGIDRIYGYGGNDFIDGGAGSDRLEGGTGSDTLFGQGGNDKFFTRDKFSDQLFGGSGEDTADRDTLDVLSSVTSLTAKS